MKFPVIIHTNVTEDPKLSTSSGFVALTPLISRAVEKECSLYKNGYKNCN